jgi:hypothetical protein
LLTTSRAFSKDSTLIEAAALRDFNLAYVC